MNPPAPTIRTRDEHRISRRDIDPDALKVLYRLARSGHTAYLVGGGVRDLLLGRHPKDFDVGTDARPRQVKKLFRNCFLIGRRFRLAHIKYGDHVIETSTFRRAPEPADADEDATGLLQRSDNTFGPPEEDARRRDFTINGLFYDIETFSVIDYVGGLDDLSAGLVRAIGDPDIRFCEDPVRMIRAVRFASRLGFRIEDRTFAAIERHGEKIQQAAPARMFEEIQRLFAFSSVEPAFRLLRESGLLAFVFPELERAIDEIGTDNSLLWKHLAALDAGAYVLAEPTPALRFATLYCELLHRKLPADGDPALFESTVRDVLQPLFDRLPVPRRIQDRMRRIFVAQERFRPAKGKRRFSKSRFVAQASFPEALALFEIHTQATGQDAPVLQEWQQRYEDRDDKGDKDSENRARSGTGAGRRRRRSKRSRKRKPRSGNGKATGAAENAAAAEDGETAQKTKPKKRRKRSKRSGGKSGREKRPAPDGDQGNATPPKAPQPRKPPPDASEPDISKPLSGNDLYRPGNRPEA